MNNFDFLRNQSPHRKAHRPSLLSQFSQNSLQIIEENPEDSSCKLKKNFLKSLKSRHLSLSHSPQFNRPPSPIPSAIKNNKITYKRKSLPNNLIDSSESENDIKTTIENPDYYESFDSSLSPSITSESSIFEDFSDSGISCSSKISLEDDKFEKAKKFSINSLYKIDEHLLEEDESVANMNKSANRFETQI